MLIRKKVLWLTVTCLLALCFNSTGAAENTGTLIVDINGFADSEGYAMVAVFDSEAAYMDKLEKLSLADWMALHVHDPQLKNVLSVLWGYYGLPPSRLNALFFAIATGEYIVRGGQYYKTRSQDLSDILMETVLEFGGETLMQTEATRIGTDKGRVAWVEDDNGRRYPAKAVIANVNTPDILTKHRQDSPTRSKGCCRKSKPGAHPGFWNG